MLNKGDVVLGTFVTADGKVLKHYSVVLDRNESGALLVYTTSMKENLARANPRNRFSAEDMKAANFLNPCLWDASTACVVPHHLLRKTGTVTRDTLGRIADAFSRARRDKSLRMSMYTEKGEVVCA